MTNELEKKFFDTFGIEPKLTFYDLVRLKESTNQKLGGRCNANWQGETKEETIRRFSPRDWEVLECKDVYTYPQINDRVLLELICIATASEITVEFKGIKNVEHLKEVVLNYCIERYRYCLHKDEFKHQVRTLFEEEIFTK